MPRATAAAGLVAVFFFAGCSESPPDVVPAEVVVTLGGQPLPHAEVRFVPKLQGFGAEYIASGVTDENGRATLSLPGKPGACACENLVIVAEGPLPDEARGASGKAQMAATQFMAGLKNRPIPDTYTTAAQSPLTVTVTPDQAEYKFELTR